mgnify:FL=1
MFHTIIEFGLNIVVEARSWLRIGIMVGRWIEVEIENGLGNGTWACIWEQIGVGFKLGTTKI